MTDDLNIWLAILGMALVTYLTRISGYFIALRIQQMPRRVEALLTYIPGTIIVSIIAPQVVSSGWRAFLAAGICLAASLWFKNMVAVMVTGVAAISLLRHFVCA